MRRVVRKSPYWVFDAEPVYEGGYTWSEASISAPWVTVQAWMLQCLREHHQGPYGFSWFCYPDADGQGTFCDVMRNSGFGSPQLVSGQIRVRGISADRSEVAIGLRHWLDREDIRLQWVRTLQGEAACPKRQ